MFSLKSLIVVLVLMGFFGQQEAYPSLPPRLSSNERKCSFHPKLFSSKQKQSKTNKQGTTRLSLRTHTLEN